MQAKLKNFWYYHKIHLLIAAAVLAVSGYLGLQTLLATQPDYHIGIVRAVPLTEEEQAVIRDAFAAAGTDINGDGEIAVKLHTYFVDLADPDPNAGVNNAQVVAALDADLIGHVSGIFLLEDVETFRQITGGLIGDNAIRFGHGLQLTLRKDADPIYADLALTLAE